MKISWSQALMDKFGEFVHGEQNNLFQERLKYVKVNLWNYLIDWRVRDGVNLRNWLKEQVDDPFGNEIVKQEKWKDIKNMDDRILAILRYVTYNYNYQGDQQVWDTPEKWATFKESYALGRGDCEDGAIAIFVLARKAGIPENRIMVCAGNVIGGGHCWVIYSSNDANQYAIDWCYWLDMTDIDERSIFWDLKNYYYGLEIWFGVTDQSMYVMQDGR